MSKSEENRAGETASPSDQKAEHRTKEQERAVWYFDPDNIKPVDLTSPDGCKTSLTNQFKGCFRRQKKPGCFSKVINFGRKVKGCFAKKVEQEKPKYMPDEEYDALIQGIVDRLDVKARGLQKLVLDESQVEKTIKFANFKYYNSFNDLDFEFYWKIGEDGKFRSSVFEVTYLFLTKSQIAAYKLSLSSEWEKHDERTIEYHYRDVTALSTNTYQKDILKDDLLGKKKEYRTVQNEFTIIVPGDSFSVSLGNKPTPEEESAIQAMKALLKEKKA